MKELHLTLLLLFFELSYLQGHVITKREVTDVDRYAVKSDKDTIEIINPKAQKPTLREIIFYHVIEKPYPNTQIDDNEAENVEPFENPNISKPGPVENDIPTSSDIKKYELPDDEPQNLIIDDTLAEEDENDQVNDKDSKEDENDIDLTGVIKYNDQKAENDRPVKNRRPIHIAENEPTDSDRKVDEDLLDDEEVPNKEDTVKQNRIPDLKKIEDDKTIRFRDFITEDEKPRVTRRKRDIDYSKMHDAPALPLFRMDSFPDYIKEILPSNNELDIPTETEKPAFPSKITENPAFLSRGTKKPEYLSRGTDKPAYTSRTTEKPAYLSRTTEESVYLTEKPEVAKKPLYLSKTTEKPIVVMSENSRPKISVTREDEEEDKMKNILARNIDDEIEKEISEAIRNVVEAQDMNNKIENPSFGMNLIGNNGVVWNDLQGQHFIYNVGPDATNTEDHNAQIPFKPTTEKPEKTTEIDFSSEIQSALEEIGHIFEEILDETDDQEDNEPDTVTTENYDIHVNINKDHDKNENFEEKTEKPNDFEKEELKVYENQSLDGQIKPKTVKNDDDQDTLDRVMDFLQVLQDLVETSKKNESENQEVIEPSKDSNRDNSESNSNDEKQDNSDTSDAVKDLLNNDNYWKWLKDTSESYMNIIMKQVLGLIKEEVAKQKQHLVFKMMEEQGDAPPDDHHDKPLDKHDSDSSTEKHEEENGDNDSTLNADDKYWNWLKDSSEAYFNILMKRVLGDIAEGVANQIDLIGTKIFEENGYTAPKKDENFKQEDNEEDSDVIQRLKSNDKWEWLTKSSDEYLDKTMKRANKLIEEEVTRQITDLVKYHMPSNNDEQTNTENNPDENDDSGSESDDRGSESDEELLRKPKDQLDKSKDEVNNKKRKDEKKHKHEHAHKHEQDHKDKHNDHELKNKEEIKDKSVKILATNAYGTSVNNEKVTNIFIFGLNSSDLKHLKPISGGNGVFMFGTDNKEPNKDSEKLTTDPNEVTNNLNIDHIPQNDKVQITSTTPIKEELETDSESNKDENDKDNSKEKENQETPEEASDKSEENPKASTEHNYLTEDIWGKPEEENTDKDSKDNSTEYIGGKSEENDENTDNDSKDNALEDEDKIVIDERFGEIDETKDNKEIKDSTEIVKEKESTDKNHSSETVKEEDSTDKIDSSEIVKVEETADKKDSGEIVKEEESADKKDSSEIVKEEESTDKKDSSESVKDKDSSEI